MNRLLYFATVLPISLLLLLAAASTILADTVTYDDAVPERFVPISDMLTFPRFDPSTGILTSIDISVTSTIVGSIDYTNIITEPIFVGIEVTGAQGVGLLSGGSLSTQEILASVNETLGISGTQEASGSVSFNEDLSDAITLSDGGSFGDFVGNGNVELPILISASWDASGGNPNITVSLRSRASAVGQLRYNFVIPEVTLQKYTNGFDADDASDLDVPEITPGEPVTWTYVVTNTGTISVPVADVVVTDSIAGVTPVLVPASDDGDDLLAPGEAWTYQAAGVVPDLSDPAQTAGMAIVPGCDERGISLYGQRETYENVGTVTVPGFSTSDPSHYCNPAVPDIAIEKSTNDADADNADAPGVPELSPGEGIVWTYVVNNTGNVTFTLEQVMVTDSIGGVSPVFEAASDDGDGLLSPGESWSYRADGNAVDLLDAGQIDGFTIVPGCSQDGASVYGQRATYENIGVVQVPGAEDSDPSHYCNPAQPGIDIEKQTNGSEADGADGSDVPEISPSAPVVWTYVVTNTGNVTFTAGQVDVTDSIGDVTPLLVPASDDGDGLLSPGESWTYQADGIAADLLDPGQIDGLTIVSGCSQEGTSVYGQRATYENIGSVRVPGSEDSDASHYCNPAQPGIAIEKSTNGADADLANGLDVPAIEPGQQVRWEYLVTNTGNVTFTLAQVSVTDDILTVAPVFDNASDNGDGALSPGESWRYTASGNAADLEDFSQTEGMTLVQGCGQGSTVETNLRPTYENIGAVQVPGAEDSDPSHYCNPLAPTSIDLVSFVAVQQEDGIHITWQVATEIDTAGYLLYRSTGAREGAVQLNNTLIPIAGETASWDVPLRYAYVDEMVADGVAYNYWLREVTVTGGYTEYGPVSATVSGSSMTYRLFLPAAIK